MKKIPINDPHEIDRLVAFYNRYVAMWNANEPKFIPLFPEYEIETRMSGARNVVFIIVGEEGMYQHLFKKRWERESCCMSKLYTIQMKRPWCAWHDGWSFLKHPIDPKDIVSVSYQFQPWFGIGMSSLSSRVQKLEETFSKVPTSWWLHCAQTSSLRIVTGV